MEEFARLKFNFLIVIRRLFRNKLYTAISLLSITVAFGLIFFLLNFVIHELKTDQFHHNKNQIVRVLYKFGTQVEKFSASTPNILAPTLKDEIPDVANYARIMSNFSKNPISVHTTINASTEKDFFYTDQSFFKIFTFPIILGSIDMLDNTPDGIVISESKALNYFGKTNPIGQQITFDFYDDDKKKVPKAFQVVAVMKDIPSESTIKADFIITYNDFKNSNDWGNHSYLTFLQLQPNANLQSIEHQIAEIQYANFSKEFEPKPQYQDWKLQPLTDIHFHSGDAIGGSVGSLIFIKILIVISVLILCVASFNYLLLNSSLSVKYFNNQKILSFNGASKKDIFIGESIYTLIQILLSLLLAIPLSRVIHSHFGPYLVNNQQFILFNDMLVVVILFSFFILLGLSFALFLGRILSKAVNQYQNKSINLRKQQAFNPYFIVGQIAVFTMLLMSSLVLIKQMNFIQTNDPGCNLNNTYAFQIPFHSFSKTTAIKEELFISPHVASFSHGTVLPYESETIEKIEISNDPENTIDSKLLQGDSEYINVYGIPLVDGRNMDPEKQPKKEIEFFLSEKNWPIEVLVNESFAKKLNKKNVLGTLISNRRFKSGIIVGVVKDFHAESYYKPIEPTIIAYNINSISSTYIVKSSPGFLAETIEHVKSSYNKVLPGLLFTDWHYNPEETYKKDMGRAKLISGLTLVTILISLLGLIGWSLLTTEAKTKEIGIRKVNGATISEILAMLNKDFVKWVAIAFGIATPIAYYAMSKWLENFAYKTELSWWIFALAGLLALGIALLTVSWESWKAATRNPVEALRYE